MTVPQGLSCPRAVHTFRNGIFWGFVLNRCSSGLSVQVSSHYSNVTRLNQLRYLGLQRLYPSRQNCQKTCSSVSCREATSCNIMYLVFQMAWSVKSNPHWAIPQISLKNGRLAEELCGFCKFIFSKSQGKRKGVLKLSMRFPSGPGWADILIPPRLLDAHHWGGVTVTRLAQLVTEPLVVREPSAELPSQGAK